ncbi:2-amino-4-hydroxy-6-hydroxymethyldihydropteridine diphosphokinase [Litorimonas sp. WD9-15]|uniref:2-amino-4-hydroxy-6- hydroxymethyldihydropteridine diphosphokinase n=1 Tax=Litorimonas sp. WD9-15 TaxID=3418716 RepID=UPI003CFC4D18
MTKALIGFGANLSNPKQTFLTALDMLDGHSVELLARSSLWSSPAWPAGSCQPDYINATVKVEFVGEAETLLSILQSVEMELGRVRSVRNAARTLDLDLLVFGNTVQETDALILPHPRMLDRAFVLLPLSEIDAVWLRDLAKLPSAQIDEMRYLGNW